MALMQTIEHWSAWKEKCALALCSLETQAALRGFAHSRFRKYAAAYGRTTNVPEPHLLTPEPAVAWHLLETHSRLGNTRQGKSYKKWLFARGGGESGALDGIQAGATLLVRDVVREQLRREYSPPHMVALDAPAGVPEGDFPTGLHELLPGPWDTRADVEERDMESIALAEAASFFAVLTRRERVALLAREVGLPLSHPSVTEAAGCGKSVLSGAYRDTLIGFARRARAVCAQEDRATQARMAIRLLEDVKPLILAWGKSENVCARLFYIAGRRHGPRSDEGV